MSRLKQESGFCSLVPVGDDYVIAAAGDPIDRCEDIGTKLDSEVQLAKELAQFARCLLIGGEQQGHRRHKPRLFLGLARRKLLSASWQSCERSVMAGGVTCTNGLRPFNCS